MSEVSRTVLGSYMSAECFRYLRLYGEETAGRGFIVHAGKQRGLSLSDTLKGLSMENSAEVVEMLNKVLGKDGTRLCIVEKCDKTGSGYRFTISESACSTGVKTDTPNCAFTMGVFLGITELLTGKRHNVHETDCVATGHTYCIYEVETL
ncbi:MAG TPA: 4-vinyl reductase [Chloroflexia bacterium]|nr:4-vinyl reductase [Chloroflexia bacterium]